MSIKTQSKGLFGDNVQRLKHIDQRPIPKYCDKIVCDIQCDIYLIFFSVNTSNHKVNMVNVNDMLINVTDNADSLKINA